MANFGTILALFASGLFVLSFDIEFWPFQHPTELKIIDFILKRKAFKSFSFIKSFHLYFQYQLWSKMLSFLFFHSSAHLLQIFLFDYFVLLFRFVQYVYKFFERILNPKKVDKFFRLTLQLLIIIFYILEHFIFIAWKFIFFLLFIAFVIVIVLHSVNKVFNLIFIKPIPYYICFIKWL